MSADELYSKLRSSGYTLFANANGRLGIRGPRPLAAHLMVEVRRRKLRLLELVATEATACPRNPHDDSHRLTVGHSDGFPPVPNGWSRTSWMERLRYLADRCEALVPDRAEWLRQWAQEIEQR